jgi:hypothetical protein
MNRNPPPNVDRTPTDGRGFSLAAEHTGDTEKWPILDAGYWMLTFIARLRAKRNVLLSFRPSAASGGIWLRMDWDYNSQMVLLTGIG